MGRSRKEWTSQRRQREALGGEVIPLNEWIELCKKTKKCPLCHKQIKRIELLRKDHIIPVGAPGSRNSIENIQPLCEQCNSAKGRMVIDLRKGRSCLWPIELNRLNKNRLPRFRDRISEIRQYQTRNK